ncbi:MAG: cysteine desulfurase [Verrucomicrobiae bacterium]|nr:cysteine desulfurase [Verrucomicrobiae bacterium]
MKRIYLDYNATTPLDPKVLEAMLPYLKEKFGNPSSIHAEGRLARAVVDESRDQLAAILGAKSHEIIFTGSGTESNNLAILGLALANAERGKHIITSQIEHHAVLHACQLLEKRHGFTVTYLPVDASGLVDEEKLRQAIRPETTLISLMSANNETGTRQSVEKIGHWCREQKILFHVDAIQSFGKEPVNVKTWSVDALSLAAHKFYGPKGVGALFLRSGLSLAPTLVGGAQENQRRPGTENVAAIVGLTVAAQQAVQQISSEMPRQQQWIENFWGQLSQAVTGLHRNGDSIARIANTLNVSVEEVKGEELLIACDLEGLALSSGSACMVGSMQPSYVLLAMGVPPQLAQAALRFSIGKLTEESQISEIIPRFKKVIAQLRSQSSK